MLFRRWLQLWADSLSVVLCCHCVRHGMRAAMLYVVVI